MTLNHLAFYPKQGSTLHVGVIPDGGRRWAKAHHSTLAEAYDKSREILQRMAVFFFSKNVDTFSIYVASVENFKRNSEDKAAFCEVVDASLKTDFMALAHQLQVRIKIVGDRNLLTNSLLKNIEEIETKTIDHQKGIINLCIAYHPVHEIQSAIERSNHQNNFLEYLDIKKPVNFVIRTGDANVLSNFLPLQSGFARLYFLKKLFNNLSMDEVAEIYKGYLELNLKYGE